MVSSKEYLNVGYSSIWSTLFKPNRQTLGYVTTASKIPWQYFYLRGEFAKQLKEKMGKDIPIQIETNVNACAHLECKLLLKEQSIKGR